MDADVNAQNSSSDPAQTQPQNNWGSVSELTLPTGAGTTVTVDTGAEAALPAIDPSQLKPDQFRAYDIVVWHLEQTLSGKKLPPLRMIVHGEGGTGKSRVIQTITEYFIQRGSKYLLLKAVYTGVTASIIDGKTTHIIGMISTSGRPMSNETKAKLQQFWHHFMYLVINEISMISKSFFAVLSRHVGIGKAEHDISSHSFGGINLILCSDSWLHQLAAWMNNLRRIPDCRNSWGASLCYRRSLARLSHSSSVWSSSTTSS